MRRIIIVAITLFLFISCSDKEIKKVSDDSKIAQEAFAVADAIKEAYIKKDLQTIERNATNDGYREIIGALKSFDKVEMTLSPKWVEIEKSAVSVKMVWDGRWVVRGQAVEDRGLAVFVFEGSPLKLARILRANPFRQPE